MDGMRFDLDYRLENMFMVTENSFREQIEQMELLKRDLSKHLNRGILSLTLQFKVATLIGKINKILNEYVVLKELFESIFEFEEDILILQKMSHKIFEVMFLTKKLYEQIEELS